MKTAFNGEQLNVYAMAASETEGKGFIWLTFMTVRACLARAMFLLLIES